jgi:membrane peptidoglycan carboxypeptidase
VLPAWTPPPIAGLPPVQPPIAGPPIVPAPSSGLTVTFGPPAGPPLAPTLPPGSPPAGPGRLALRPSEPRRHRRVKRRRWPLVVGIVLILLAASAAAGAVYYRDVPTPRLLPLPSQTILYYGDGQSVLAKIGSANRRVLNYDQFSDVVIQAAVAADDPDFWTDSESKISRQVVRAVAPPPAGISAQGRLWAATRKLEGRYSKQEILTYYLNAVSFGRRTFGIEAAASEYFGKSALRTAPPQRRLTAADAMLLVAMIDEPEADPGNPTGAPGVDPTRSPQAKAHALDRWNAIRDEMSKEGYLTDPGAVTFPTDVRPASPSPASSGLDQPVGLAAQHALAEARALLPGKDLTTGGYDIVTTIDQRAEAAVVKAASAADPSSVMAHQRSTMQAAAVIVDPRTGRVLAYYGGDSGTGADYAGYYVDETGTPTGYGEHPPGQTFEVYDLATALQQGVSLDSRWDSPTTSKEFPQVDRVPGKLGPVPETGRAACQPSCTLAHAAQASLVIPFFDLTEHLGPQAVLKTARDAGIADMWDVHGQRQQLTGESTDALVPAKFSTDLGIGAFPVTVLDQAAAMATFSNGGRALRPHFVISISAGGGPLASEPSAVTDLGLTPGQSADLATALSGNPLGHLPGIDSATQSGTWQMTKEPAKPAHAWMVGYTPELAMAVWVGNQGAEDPLAATAADGEKIPAAIYRAAMVETYRALGLTAGHFGDPGHTGDLHPDGSI